MISSKINQIIQKLKEIFTLVTQYFRSGSFSGKSLVHKLLNFVLKPKSKCGKAIASKIEYIQIKYFHKGELKNHVLIKYLFKDLFLYFLVAFIFFFMVFFVNQILLEVEKLLANSAPFSDVMKMMLYSLPFIIAQSTPYATLVGFLMCLGGMMSNNEILIFRASGISFFTILIPVVILGTGISIVSFFVNDYLLPLGTVKYNELMREIIYSTPTVELESNSVKKMDGSNLVIGEVTGENVSDLIIFNTKDSKTDQIIIAGNSKLTGSEIRGVLMNLNMSDAVVFSITKNKRSDYDVLKAENAELNVFESAILGSSSRSPREMTAPDLYKDIKRLEENLNESSLSDKYRIRIWNMEFHKKFALPFGSIFFAFLAYSLAFIFGKHNGQTIGLFLGIVICVLYWAMQIMGQLFVQKVGLDPFLCIWVPNILIGVVALFFFIKLVKK